MKIDDNLKLYESLGFTLLSLQPRSKRPIDKGWQQRTPSKNNLDDFANNRNVGVVLGKASGGLVDIDIDHQLAITVADYLLPSTGMVFGRASKPRSHRLYKVEKPSKTLRLNGSSQHGTIIECRANGGLTIMPPSIHPSGEDVTFDEQGKIATSTREELDCCCRLIAAVVELSGHYTKSKRHDIALAFSGILVKLGYDSDIIRACIKALCAITKDEELEDRQRCVDDTLQRYGRGQPVAGWQAMRDVIGTEAVGHFAKQLGVDTANYAGPSRKKTAIHDDLNDAGNADRLVATTNKSLIYVPELDTFLMYDSGCWNRDSSGLKVRALAEQAAKKELKALTSHRAEERDPASLEYRRRFFGRSLNIGQIRATIEMAKTRVKIPLELLDADDHLLGVQNGVLNLDTLKMEPNARDLYITRQANVTFDPQATCPKFEAFLNQTFGKDEALIDYVKGYLGYCLSGRTNRQEFHMFSGDGANGKSTLISVVQQLMGDYARSMLSSTMFEGASGEQGNYDLAQLTSVRLAVAQEAESKHKLHGARLKQMTGGDTISARAIYKAPITFRPKAKIVMVTNRRPELDAYDEALKRRLRVIPFAYQVPEAQRDPNLVAKLICELPGILNLLAKAGVAFAAGEISAPQAIRHATTGYFAEKDHVAAFLKEETRKLPSATVSKADLHAAYVDWCSIECVPSISRREFTTIMRSKGYEDTRTNQTRIWKNLQHSQALLNGGEPEDTAEILDWPGSGAMPAANTA